MKAAKEYNKRLGSNQYLFLIKKCCGYGFLLPFYKQATLKELYRFIGYELKPSKPLFISYTLTHAFKTRNTPLDVSELYLKEPIMNGQIKPIYRLPAPVVYEIYLDDGHHSDCRAIFG